MELNRRGFMAGLAGVAASLAIPFKAFAQPDISGIELYSVEGQTIFPVYCAGAPSSVNCILPILRRRDSIVAYRHDAFLVDVIGHRGCDRELHYRTLQEDAKLCFAEALRRGDPWTETEDGGPFPEPGKISIFRLRKDFI